MAAAGQSRLFEAFLPHSHHELSDLVEVAQLPSNTVCTPCHAAVSPLAAVMLSAGGWAFCPALDESTRIRGGRSAAGSSSGPQRRVAAAGVVHTAAAVAHLAGGGDQTPACLAVCAAAAHPVAMDHAQCV